MSLTAENALKKIPYTLMMLTGFGIIVSLFFTGLVDINIQTEDLGEDEFMATTVLQNLLTYQVPESKQGSLNYEYSGRRATLPVELFTQEATDSQLGYMEESSYCYIPEVNGLDGENFAVFIEPLSETSYDLECTQQQGISTRRQVTVYTEPVSAPVTLQGEKGRVLARVSVYQIL
ncbi:hypothetical protein [Candidatus Nanohalococcus occultus]|uniref:hypothetical protein n=1 Tax=Candidatus Nanohalococcus occultus TaxID=2978047 RepID=UPI0039DF7C6C